MGYPDDHALIFYSYLAVAPATCCVRDLVVVFGGFLEPSALVNDRDTPMLFSYTWLRDCSSWTVVMIREGLVCSVFPRSSARAVVLL